MQCIILYQVRGYITTYYNNIIVINNDNINYYYDCSEYHTMRTLNQQLYIYNDMHVGRPDLVQLTLTVRQQHNNNTG